MVATERRPHMGIGFASRFSGRRGRHLFVVRPVPSAFRPEGVGGALVTTVRDIRLLAYHAGQCDPKKCTSLRLQRFGLLTLVPRPTAIPNGALRSEEHTSELQSRLHLVCRLLLE